VISLSYNSERFKLKEKKYNMKIIIQIVNQGINIAECAEKIIKLKYRRVVR